MGAQEKGTPQSGDSGGFFYSGMIWLQLAHLGNVPASLSNFPRSHIPKAIGLCPHMGQTNRAAYRCCQVAHPTNHQDRRLTG